MFDLDVVFWTLHYRKNRLYKKIWYQLITAKGQPAMSTTIIRNTNPLPSG
jgi:hypothetical protein